MDHIAKERQEITEQFISDLTNEKIHVKNALDKYNARLQVLDEMIDMLKRISGDG
jgi:hypothetical protein